MGGWKGFGCDDGWGMVEDDGRMTMMIMDDDVNRSNLKRDWIRCYHDWRTERQSENGSSL